MFKNDTLFLLGAGASWHYGYPTGEQLVQSVAAKAAEAEHYFATHANEIQFIPAYIRQKQLANGPSSNRKQAWREAHAECNTLISRIRRANPLVIDYFLGQNVDLQPIGKLLISMVILECEARYKAAPGNHNLDGDNAAPPVNKPYDWCRFLLHKLVVDCEEPQDLIRNKVRFVTFNYDVSLETKLYDGLSAIHYFGREEVDGFFDAERFLHIYGSIRDCPPFVAEIGTFQGYKYPLSSVVSDYDEHVMRNFDLAFEASRRILTIDPHDKGSNDSVLRSARRAFRKAPCIYILGYGFDRNNNERLLLSKWLRVSRERTAITGKAKSIMFTNFQDRNQVNKRASNVFFGTFDRLLSNQPAILGDPKGPFFVEKSTRDVYGALELARLIHGNY